MTWLRLDDKFPEHEKLMQLSGVGAKWLHVAALCNCAANLTDGLVTAQRLKVICAVADVPRPANCVEQLVRVGLWLELDDGAYQIRDYLDYNPDAATVKAGREQRKKAGKAGAKARWDGKRHSEPHSEPHGGSGMHPDPGPTQTLKTHRPVGEQSGNDLASLQAASRLYEAIPEAGRDEGTQRVVLSAAGHLPAAVLDDIRASLEAKLAADGLFKSAGAYVNGALQKALRGGAASAA